MYKEEEIYEEKYCSDDSVAEEPVNLDEATHTDVINFCDECNFTITRKQGLNVHITVKHKKHSP